MTCIFFGHRDTPDSIRNQAEKEIRKVLENGVDEFFVGNNGRFDALIQSILKNLPNERSTCTVILSRVGEAPICKEMKNTLLPEGMESIPPRYALNRRNEWMQNKRTC